MNRGGKRYVFILRQMVYNHVAQGTLAGEPYLVTFWAVCNSGVGLIPIVDGRTHHFGAVGFVNGLSVISDKETGTLWHDKIWWVHSEALYALALAALESNDEKYFARFLDLHGWCQNNFYDPEYGEWYSSLYRDGRTKETDKGSVWKAAYHLPRALMMTMKLFEKYSN